MALALAIAMVAASLVAPVGHGPSDGTVIVSMASDEGSSPETGQATAACHGCVAHAGALLPSIPFQVVASISDADLVAFDDASPPSAATAPPVEPPRA